MANANGSDHGRGPRIGLKAHLSSIALHEVALDSITIPVVVIVGAMIFAAEWLVSSPNVNWRRSAVAARTSTVVAGVPATAPFIQPENIVNSGVRHR